VFVHELGGLMQDRNHIEVSSKDHFDILYVDETSFHLWQRPTRCWLHRGQSLLLATNRGPSLTLIGAINQDGMIVHTTIVDGSNTADTFVPFLAELKQRVPRAVVVLDNLAVHHSRRAKEIFDRKQFRSLYLPAYSSPLNPIETLWHLVKDRWRREQHKHALENANADEEQVRRNSYQRLANVLGKIGIVD